MKPDKIYTGRSTIRMYNCDCMELLNSGKTWDLAIVDPPYNIGSRQKRGIGSRIDASGKMNGWNHKAPDKIYFDTLLSVSKNQIVWGANNYVMPPSEYFCIWNKHQTVDNFASAEYAWVSMGLKKPAKVFDMTIHSHNSGINRIHPTQKPVQLYKWLLTNYAKEGDTILDTHGGSMSIAIACWDLGFDLDICELDTDYFNDAVKRFEQHISQTQLF
jgi:site-specific DNA-methyltransferase (adenine-specific)